MARGSKRHNADEFGRHGSGAITGADAPTIGAPAAIMVDALTERESGVTPPPPPISVKALAIVFTVMFVIGAVGLFFVSRIAPYAISPP